MSEMEKLLDNRAYHFTETKGYRDALKAGQRAIDKRMSEVGRLKALLSLSREKLALYRAAHGGEYLGGMEYSELIKRIDAALNEKSPPPG